MKIAEAFVEVRIDRKKADAEAKSAASSALGVMRNVFAAGVVVKGLQQAIGQASDLNETVSKTGVVFQDSAKEITAWSTNSAKQFGLSQRAALDAASTFAVFGKSAGLAGSDLTGFSTELVGLASDLASFNNTSPEQAIEAIGAALRGESEPIRAYGVLLDDATLKQRAMTLGIFDGTGSLTQQQRVLAAQAEIMAQTGLAQGDFARTADGVANSQRIAAAEAENAAASFGQVLLPVYDRVLEVVTFLVSKFAEMPAPLQTAVVGLAAFVAFSGPIKNVKDLTVDLVASFKAAGVSAGAMGTALGVVGGVIGAAVLTYQVYSQRKQEAEQRTRSLSDALLGEASAQNEALAALAENDESVKRFLEAQKQLGIQTSELTDFIRDGTGAASEIVEAWDAATVAADGTYPTLDAFASSLGLSSEMTYEQIAALRDFVYQLEELRAGELERAATQELVNDVTGQAAPIVDAATVASEDLTVATDDVAAAQKKAADAADKQRQAIEDLYNEMIGQVDAQRAYERSLDDSEQALSDFDAVLADNKSTLEDIQDASRSTTDQLIETAKAYAELETGSITSKAGIDKMIESLYAQAVALGPDSPVRAELLAYIAELQKIPPEITTAIKLHVTGNTITKDGDIIGVRPVGAGAIVQNARGSFVPANSNLLSTLAEPGAGAEAVLPLQNRNRLVELLGDPRIGGPISEAMGGGSSVSSSSVAVTNNVTVLGESDSYIEWLRSQLDALERSRS